MRDDGAMDNPWRAVPPGPPYVLLDDKPHLDAFNHHRLKQNDDAHRLELDQPPAPFIGDLATAKVVVFGLNPHTARQPDEQYVARSLRALAQADHEYPFWPLAPDLSRHPDCGGWTKRLLGPLVDHREKVAQSIALVNFHGYRSRSWAKLGVTLPSQCYGFEQVRSVIDRQALIVVVFGWQDWTVAIPELLDYEGVRFVKKRPRPAMRIVEENFEDRNVFSEIKEALLQAETLYRSTIVIGGVRSPSRSEGPTQPDGPRL
jgi:hypothetical protein